MENLKRLRQGLGLSQLKMSEKLKMASSTYQQYEAGIHEPNFKTLIEMADYFHVTVDYLVDRTRVRTLPTEKDLEMAYQLNRLENAEAKDAIFVILKNLKQND